MLVLTSLIGFSQGQGKSIYIDYSNPQSISQLSSLRNLKDVRIIHFNNPSNIKLFTEHLLKVSQIEDLEKVILSNYSHKKLPDEIKMFEFISEVTILSSPELNLKNTFKQLGELFVLSKLNLANNNIVILPKEIELIENLVELNITLNSGLNLEESLNVLKGVKTIKKLGLPVNQLSEVPENIGEIENLQELDLTDNNLTDLPNSISKLDSLTTLKLEKNIIVHPSGTYQKLNKLNIKYLSIDKGLSDMDIDKLQTIFPEAKIEQINDEKLNQDKIDNEMRQLKDSLRVEIIKQRDLLSDSAKEDSVVVFIKPPKGVKVFSMAYTHYIDVFKDMPITHDFDSLLFEERFRDTNYYNTHKRQKGLSYEFVNLKMIKPFEKNQIWFEFIEDGYFYRNYPELEAFNDMVWVVVGMSDKKAFKESYVKHKSFSDFRLVYQSGDKNFKMVLKSSRGFEEFIVVPRFPNKGSKIEKNQSSYEKRNIKYLELLNKRKLEFNKTLFREKAKYRYNLIRIRDKTWNDFRKMYFSQAEKQLSISDWLIYYDDVISNELQALKRSPIKNDFLIRTLRLLDYKHVKNISEIKKEQGTQIGLFSFQDQSENDLAITSLFVVNKSLNHFKIYNGSVGVKEFYLFFREVDDYSIIAVLRNGDIASMNKLDFKQIEFKQQITNVMSLYRMEKSLTTIDLVLRRSGL